MNQMKWVKWSMVALIVTMFAAACDDDDDNNNSKEWTQTDQNFVTKANEGNRAEIEIAALASSRSSTNVVKDFAATMIDDHNEALEELKNLADNREFALSTNLSAEHEALKSRLAGYTGFTFDTAYIKSQLEAHSKVIALFEAESNNGDDQALKNYANKYLPGIRVHFTEATSINVMLTDTIPAPGGD